MLLAAVVRVASFLRWFPYLLVFACERYVTIRKGLFGRTCTEHECTNNRESQPSSYYSEYHFLSQLPVHIFQRTTVTSTVG